MKQKINYWIIYFFLIIGTSFLHNGGVFNEHTERISLSNGKLGAIKLSGKMPTIQYSGNSSFIRD